MPASDDTVRPPLQVRIRRGDVVESQHRVHAVVLGPDGPLLRAGDLDRPFYLRSAAKPFQALAALDVILGAGREPEDGEVAVIAASHSGQPLHVGLVQGILERAGLPESALKCGAHRPYHGPAADALVRGGLQPRAVQNNCSGKHAGMLWSARLSGEDPATYLSPSHGVQRRARAALARFIGRPPESVRHGIDGCGAPAWVATLAEAARAFQGLASSGEPAIQRLFEAVAREPVAYAGTGELCSRLAEAGGGTLLPKIGAEGFYGLAARGRRFAVALKVEDGARRAVEPALSALLQRFAPFLPDGLRETLGPAAAAPVLNHAGRVVGRTETLLP